MKLTDEEQKICDKYSGYDEHGLVHCDECPLVKAYEYLQTHELYKDRGIWKCKEKLTEV